MPTTCPKCSETLMDGECVYCGWRAPKAPTFVDSGVTVGATFFRGGNGWVAESIGASFSRDGGTFFAAVCRAATAEEIATKRAAMAADAQAAADARPVPTDVQIWR